MTYDLGEDPIDIQATVEPRYSWPHLYILSMIEIQLSRHLFSIINDE